MQYEFYFLEELFLRESTTPFFFISLFSLVDKVFEYNNPPQY